MSHSFASSTNQRRAAVRSSIQKDYPKIFGMREITIEEKHVLARQEKEGENTLSLVYDTNEGALMFYRNHNRVSVRNKHIKLDLSSMRQVFFVTPPGNSSTVVIQAVRIPGPLSAKEVIYTIQFEDWIEVIYFEDFLHEHGPKQLVRFESPSPPTTAEEREAAAIDLDWKPDSRDSNEELYIAYNVRPTVAPGGPSGGGSKGGSQTVMPTSSPVEQRSSASVKVENAIDLTDD